MAQRLSAPISHSCFSEPRLAAELQTQILSIEALRFRGPLLGCALNSITILSKLSQPFMDQPCYKCGHEVEEGRVFCPHCSAPQIRVVVAEAVAAMPATSAAQAQLPSSETVPVIAVPMRWDQAAQPCAIAALIAALGIVFQLIVPVIAAIGAGFLAVALYRRRNPEISIHTRTGARIGAICGFFCFGMTVILGALRVAILHEGGKIRTTLLDLMQQQAGRYSDPQSQAMFEFFKSPTGFLLLLVFMFIFGLITLILLGMLGGALGGAGLSRRDRS